MQNTLNVSSLKAGVESLPLVQGSYRRDLPIKSNVNPNVYMPSAGGTSARPQYPLIEYVPYKAVDYVPAPTGTEGNLFTNSIKRGWEQTKGVLDGMIGLTGDLVGADSLSKYGYEEYARHNQVIAERYPSLVPTLEDIPTEEFWGSAANALIWGVERFGEMIPSAAVSLGSGVVANVVARTATSELFKRGAAASINTAVTKAVAEKGVTREMAEAAAARAFKIRMASQGMLVATTTAMEAGGNWAQDYETYGEGYTSPAQDLAFGFLSGLSETILGAEGSIIKRMTGQPVTQAVEQSFRQALIRNIPKSMAQEGLQEGLQELTSVVNQALLAGDVTLDSEDLSNILNAAAAGAIGGFGFGSGAAAWDKFTKAPENALARENGYTKNADGTSTIKVGSSTINLPPVETIDRDAIKNQAIADTMNNRFEDYAAQAGNIYESQLTLENTNYNNNLADLDTKKTQGVQLLDQINKQLAAVTKPNTQTASQMSPEQRESISQAVRKEQQTVLVELANIEKNRKELIADHGKKGRVLKSSLQKSLDKAVSDGIRSPQRTVDDRLQTDPIVQSQMSEVSKDATVFANRQIRKLTNKASRVNKWINQYNKTLSSMGDTVDVAQSKFIQGQLDILNKKNVDISKRIKQIKDIATKVVRTTVAGSTAEVEAISDLVNELHSLTSDGMTSNDADIIVNTAEAIADRKRESHKENVYRIKQMLNNLANTPAPEGTNVKDLPIYRTLSDLLAAEQAAANMSTPITVKDLASEDQAFKQSIAISQKADKLLESAELTYEKVKNLSYELSAQRSNEDYLNFIKAREDAVKAKETAAKKTNDDIVAIKAEQAKSPKAKREADTATRESKKNAKTDRTGFAGVTTDAPVKVAAVKSTPGKKATPADVVTPDMPMPGRAKTRADKQKKMTPVRAKLEAMLDKLPLLKEHTVLVEDPNDPSLPGNIRSAFVTRDVVGLHSRDQNMIYLKLYDDVMLGVANPESTLIHEGVVHFGLRGIFSPSQQAEFTALVANSFEKTELWRRWLDNMPSYGELSKAKQGEEFIAWIAASRDLDQLLRAEAVSIFRTLRKFLHGVLQKLGLVNLTMGDIDNVIALSAQHLANVKSIPEDVNLLTYIQDGVIPPRLASLPEGDPELPSYNHNSLDKFFGFTFPTLLNANEWVATYNKWKYQDTPSAIEGLPLPLGPLTGVNTVDLNMTIADVTENAEGFDITNIVTELRSAIAEANNTSPSDPVIIDYVNNTPMIDALTVLDQRFGGKTAAQLMRSVGIMAGTYSSLETGNTSAIIFAGDDLKVPDNGFHSPVINAKADEILFSIVDDAYSMLPSDMYKQDFANRYLKDRQEHSTLKMRLAQSVRSIMRTGESVGADGKLIKHGLGDRFLEMVNDPYRRVKITQKYLKQVFGDGILNATTNIYKNLTGLSNIIHSAQKQLYNRDVVPFMEAFNKLHIPGIDNKNFEHKIHIFGVYMTARHAGERNAHLAARLKVSNPADNLSGMSTREATEILSVYDSVPGMKEAANLIDSINDKRLSLIEFYGLMGSEDTMRMRRAYEHYVPFKNWDELIDDMSPEYAQRKSRSGISMGTRDVTKYAKGRELGLAENPVINSILQYVDVVAMGEKNNISRGLLELVRSAPDNALWEVSESDKGAKKIQSDGKGNLVLRKKKHKLEGSGFKYVTVIEPDGTRVRIAIKDEVLARALRNENMYQTGTIFNTWRDMQRTLSMLYTNMNPFFIIKNPIRDLQTALLNMGNVLSENAKYNLAPQAAQIRKDIMKDVIGLRVPKFLWHMLKGGAPRTADEQYMTRMYFEFVTNGGHTRMFEARDFKSVYKMLEKEARGAGNTLQKSASAIGSVFNYVDQMSDVGENSTRFSVFLRLVEAMDKNVDAEAKRNNWSVEQLSTAKTLNRKKAANTALEITVNFTRKGTLSPIFNTLYAFSSASIGGNIRILSNLFRTGDTKAQRAKRLLSFLASGSVSAIMLSMWNRMIGGDDKDGESYYSKIPNYIKDGNIVLMSPFGDGSYVKLPLAYGYNIFWKIGNILDRAARGEQKVTSGATDMLGALFSNFYPVGDASEGVTGLVPTLFRPIAQVAANQTFSGQPIRPESTQSYKGEVPDSQKFWSTNPKAYRWLAENLNAAFGGSKVESSGYLDISPESMQHILEGYTGGMGKLVTSIIGTFSDVTSGKPMEFSKLPLVSTMVGTVGFSNVMNEFSAVRTKLQTDYNLLDITALDPTMTSGEKWDIKANTRPSVSIKSTFDTVQKELTDIRKEERDVARRYKETGSAYYSRMKQLEQRKERAMRMLIRRAKGVELDYTLE